MHPLLCKVEDLPGCEVHQDQLSLGLPGEVVQAPRQEGGEAQNVPLSDPDPE